MQTEKGPDKLKKREKKKKIKLACDLKTQSGFVVTEIPLTFFAICNVHTVYNLAIKVSLSLLRHFECKCHDFAAWYELELKKDIMKEKTEPIFIHFTLCILML